LSNIETGLPETYLLPYFVWGNDIPKLTNLAPSAQHHAARPAIIITIDRHMTKQPIAILG
jgi:hypothetical protein